MLVSIVAGVMLLIDELERAGGVPGWASLMVSLWFLGGLTIFCLGVIGVYVAKVFTETKERPYTVVRQEYRGDTRSRGVTTDPLLEQTREYYERAARPTGHRHAAWTGTRRASQELRFGNSAASW